MIMDATEKPNSADFSVDDRPREYRAHIRFEGEMVVRIMADSEDEAKQKAEDMADALVEGTEEIDPHEIEIADLKHVYRSRPMFRVIRDGQAMQVSHLAPGDVPREPDERGF